MLFLNGLWVPGQGKELVSHNPATGEVLWTGRAAGASDVDAAVTAARAAAQDWQSRTVSERAAIVQAFQSLLQERQSQLAQRISEETGKPLWDAATEVQAMIGKIPISLQALEERRAPCEISLPLGTGRVHYRPLGIIAVFGPFNFPGHIANGQIVPALLAGNTVIFKPSELTPSVAEETVRLWEQAGLPAGVLNLVQGGRETGEALARHPQLNGIHFTGSLKTGIALQQQLVGRPDVLLALELGGNNPLVVHQVQNVDAAVYWTIQSAFITAGQRCTCARRLIVTPDHEKFIQRLVDVTAQLRIAPPDSQPQPFFSSLITPDAARKVLQAQARLLAGGAVPLLSAGPLSWGAAYVSAGILDVTDCTSCQDEEIFGPLLQVIRVPDLQAAIDVANRSRYGLASALFSDNPDDFEGFVRQMRTGLVNWNRPTTGASGQLPFGGLGASGNHRPAGQHMIDACNDPVAQLCADLVTMPATLTEGISFS